MSETIVQTSPELPVLTTGSILRPATSRALVEAEIVLAKAREIEAKSREAAEREAEAVCALQCVQEAPPDTDVRGLVHEWACICLTDERAWRVREGARVGSPPSWPATPR